MGFKFIAIFVNKSMGIKLNDEQLRIYKAIDDILWNDWDPIGVKFFDGPRDEYQSYIPVIFNLKIGGGDVNAIASQLYEIESKRMDYDQGYAACVRVAEKIFNL